MIIDLKCASCGLVNKHATIVAAPRPNDVFVCPFCRGISVWIDSDLPARAATEQEEAAWSTLPLIMAIRSMLRAARIREIARWN
jgi:hypothetical protein